jgi:hypothetical protein
VRIAKRHLNNKCSEDRLVLSHSQTLPDSTDKNGSVQAWDKTRGSVARNRELKMSVCVEGSCQR